MESGILMQALTAKGLSQNELARRAGMNAGYLSLLVQGKRRLSRRIHRRLLRTLGEIGTPGGEGRLE